MESYCLNGPDFGPPSRPATNCGGRGGDVLTGLTSAHLPDQEIQMELQLPNVLTGLTSAHLPDLMLIGFVVMQFVLTGLTSAHLPDT